jgi:hypothetical protein
LPICPRTAETGRHEGAQQAPKRAGMTLRGFRQLGQRFRAVAHDVGKSQLGRDRNDLRQGAPVRPGPSARVPACRLSRVESSLLNIHRDRSIVLRGVRVSILQSGIQSARLPASRTSLLQRCISSRIQGGEFRRTCSGWLHADCVEILLRLGHRDDLGQGAAQIFRLPAQASPPVQRSRANR